MTPNYIFGLTRRLLAYKEPVRSGWILNTSGRDYSIRMGTPCLVLKHSTEELSDLGRTPHNIALIPFNTENTFNNRYVLDNHNNVKALSLKAGPETDLFDKIKELRVGQVDLSKIDRALDFVRDAGPLTLTVADKGKNRLYKDLSSVIDLISKKYKHCFMGKYDAPGKRNLMAGDEVVLHITLMDIANCIPIFDPTTVNGIVMHMAVEYTESSVQHDKFIHSCECVSMFSKFDTNLTRVDGQDLQRQKCNPSKMKEIISSLDDYWQQVGQSIPSEETKKMPEKKRKSLNVSSGPVDYATYTTTTATTTANVEW